MAKGTSDQSAKDEIKKGMSKSGKDQVKGETPATKGRGGRGADASKLPEGMSEAGSGKSSKKG
jgi:hypothetical protein